LIKQTPSFKPNQSAMPPSSDEDTKWHSHTQIQSADVGGVPVASDDFDRVIDLHSQRHGVRGSGFPRRLNRRVVF